MKMISLIHLVPHECECPKLCNSEIQPFYGIRFVCPILSSRMVLRRKLLNKNSSVAFNALRSLRTAARAVRMALSCHLTCHHKQRRVHCTWAVFS